jgi:hypothetical protein
MTVGNKTYFLFIFHTHAEASFKCGTGKNRILCGTALAEVANRAVMFGGICQIVGYVEQWI